MVKKNKILEKNDNEINKLSEAINSLNNNNIFQICKSTEKILFLSFLIGLDSGLVGLRRNYISFLSNICFIPDSIYANYG